MDSLSSFKVTDEKELHYPKYYKDSKQRRRRFIKLESHSVLTFSILFKFTSPFAVFDITPHFIKRDFNQVFVKILNYSNIQLKLDKKLNLFANNLKVSFVFNRSCHLLIYSILKFPHIACIEQKEEETCKPTRRIFLAKIGMSYEVTNFLYDEYSINTKEKGKLFAQISYPVTDSSFISTNPDYNCLKKRIDKEADLKKKPSIYKFYPRSNTSSLIVINYTKENVTYNIYRQIFIKNKYITNLYPRNCFLVVSYLTDHPEVMCIDLKYEGMQVHFPKIYTRLNWSVVAKSEILDVFKQIHYDMAYNRLWKSAYDQNSILSELPRDLLSYITIKYINILHH